MSRAINMPIVVNNEVAEAVGAGLKSLSNLSPEDREKLSKLSFEEVEKAWPDDNQRIALAHVAKALRVSSDAITGQLQYNESYQAYHQKFFGLSDGTKRDNTTLIVDNALEIQGNQGIDLGWLPAFTARDAQGVEKVKVMDLDTALRFFEMKDHTDVPKAESLGGHKAAEFGPRFFALAFKWNERDARFSVFNVNQVLSAIRRADVNCTARLAYREIARKTSNTQAYTSSSFSGLSSTYATVGANTDVLKGMAFRIREMLNAAHIEMVDRALGITKGGKKRQVKNEVALAVSSGDTFYIYFNHAHRQIMDIVQRRVIGDESGTNPILLQNYVFVESALMPVSGGWTITGEDGNDRDEFGMYGSCAEVSAKSVGASLVIPGMRNQYATFRNLTFLQDSQATTETVELVAKAERKFHMDDRQKAHVDFGSYPTVS